MRWTHVSPSRGRKAAAEFTRQDAFLPERVIAMPANSVIVWSDGRWNPIRGCSKISPGCKTCRAESYAERSRDPACNQVDEIADVQLVPQNLLKPLQWRRTSDIIFVSSMGDFFHQEVPDHFIVAAFEVMSRVDWHSYRAKRVCVSGGRHPSLAVIGISNRAGCQGWASFCNSDA